MTDIPSDPLSGIRPDSVGGVRPSAAGATGKTESSSPAFRALLEQLEERTRQLEASSQKLDSPETLAGAVDNARASLEDALSLGDQLLEAYRESRQQQAGTSADAGASKEEQS